METPWAILGWIAVLGFVAILLGFVFVVIKATVEQWHANWRRSRAHAGKVKCEGGEWVDVEGERTYIKCPIIATRVTPNGYYCDDHWMENSTRGGITAAFSWGHRLNHTVKKKETSA